MGVSVVSLPWRRQGHAKTSHSTNRRFFDALFVIIIDNMNFLAGDALLPIPLCYKIFQLCTDLARPGRGRPGKIGKSLQRGYRRDGFSELLDPDTVKVKIYFSMNGINALEMKVHKPTFSWWVFVFIQWETWKYLELFYHKSIVQIALFEKHLQEKLFLVARWILLIGKMSKNNFLGSWDFYWLK